MNAMISFEIYIYEKHVYGLISNLFRIFTNNNTNVR